MFASVAAIGAKYAQTKHETPDWAKNLAPHDSDLDTDIAREVSTVFLALYRMMVGIIAIIYCQ